MKASFIKTVTPVNKISSGNLQEILANEIPLYAAEIATSPPEELVYML
jgi:hypothetical protein